MPEYAGICVNIPKLREWIFFTFPHCNPLLTGTRGYLFQRLHETRSYALEEHETV